MASKCEMCKKSPIGDLISADCQLHSMCSTCTAVFLDGISTTPTCPKCYAALVISKYMRKRPINTGRHSNSHFTMKATTTPVVQCQQEAIGSPTPISVEALSPTSVECDNKVEWLSHLSTKSYGEAKKTYPVKVEYNSNAEFNKDKGTCCYKLDQNSGKTIRYFPYAASDKTKQNTRKETEDKFKEVLLEEENTKNDVSSIIPTNHKHAFASDLAYVDNLFAFLRDEKSKFQNMKFPSVKTRYHTVEEKEFQMNEYVTYKGSVYNYRKSPRSNESTKTKMQQKPPVMETLFNQLQTGSLEEKAKVSDTNCSKDRKLINTDSTSYNGCVYDALTIRPSTSPASDVRGEYGSEDDKHSLSSNSGSGVLMEHSDDSDKSRSFRSDGIKCPMPVYERAFSGIEEIENQNIHENYSMWDAGYNADVEEERCTSPCKAKRTRGQTSSAWLISSELPNALQQPSTSEKLMPENNISSEEEEIEDGQHSQIYGVDSSETELIYLDDGDVDEELWHI